MAPDRKGLGLALSGGGSRAIAFHYGVLEALHELGVDKKVDVVSAISGGAIIGAFFNLYRDNWSRFKAEVEKVLAEGLEAALYEKLTDFSFILRQGLSADHLSDILDKKYFKGLLLSAIPEAPCLILNTADLKTGTNFKFSRNICGSYKDRDFVIRDLKLSQAVAYSAAFTICISVKRLVSDDGNEVFLTDGGVYDGLGVNALMPDKDEKSILVQKCETVIVSDASLHYQEKPTGLTSSAFKRILSAHYCSGNRNRSLIYSKLFLLNKSGDIPHIGTIKMDSGHPDLTEGWTHDQIKFINQYGTNFKPVKGEALKLLKEKGKISTDVILKKYLSHLL